MVVEGSLRAELRQQTAALCDSPSSGCCRVKLLDMGQAQTWLLLCMSSCLLLLTWPCMNAVAGMPLRPMTTCLACSSKPAGQLATTHVCLRAGQCRILHLPACTSAWHHPLEPVGGQHNCDWQSNTFDACQKQHTLCRGPCAVRTAAWTCEAWDEQVLVQTSLEAWRGHTPIGQAGAAASLGLSARLHGRLAVPAWSTDMGRQHTRSTAPARVLTGACAW